MRLLVINGSPKGENSNTLRLTQAFVAGVRAVLPAIETETVSLSAHDVQPCRGCFACWNKTPGKCVLRDEADGILQKLLWADRIIWNFPLYFYGIPGQLKNLIDRQLPHFLPFMEQSESNPGSGGHPHRYDPHGQKHVVISTCGFYSAENNYDSVLAMFDRLFGTGAYETILCGQGELFRVKELSERTDEYLSLCERAGREYATGGIAAETKERLAQLLYPRETFEAMADASWGIDRAAGKTESEALCFTRQMAALYNRDRYDGTDRILEMHYTDAGETYQILLSGQGSRVVCDTSLPYTTRIETPFSVWQQIARGELRGDAALMEGKYRVTGDFSLLLEWNLYFGSSSGQERPTKSAPEKKRPPLLWGMLLPWLGLWIAVSIHAKTGGFLAAVLAALTQILLLGREKTVYDHLTFACVTILSAVALLTGRGTLAVGMGYALFGLLWLLSCLTKEPLCAAYVKAEYGGEDALNNPLFLRTNRILAAGWGALYLLISLWTPLLLWRGLSVAAQVINHVLTGLMGLFTVWFQKWYPAWVASGRRKRGKKRQNGESSERRS